MHHTLMKKLGSGDIKVKFLPPNVTVMLKLMDQGVTENIKLCVFTEQND